MFASLKWQDWTNVVLGLWLASSPWALGFAGQAPAMLTAFIFGLALIVFSLIGAGVIGTAKEWLNVLAGLWLVIAPFALGFTSNFHAAASTMLTGLLAAVLAAWAASLDKEIGHWWHDHVAGH